MAAACAPCQRCGGVADVSLTRDGKWLCVDCYDPAPPGPSPVSASQNGPAHADSAPIFRRDDQGNAERLVLEHGADLRFVPAIGWHFWDGVRWRRDDTGEAERRAKRTASGLYADIARVDDDEERKRILQHAIQSNRLPRIKAALELAQSDLAVVVRAAELDGHPMLLNVANGTVDLRTGQLRAHDRDEQHTKLAPVAYDPSARPPARPVPSRRHRRRRPARRVP